MNEIKLETLILSQMELQKQGISQSESVNNNIILASNLFLASECVSNSDSDNLTITNKLNSVLGNVNNLNTPFEHIF